MTLSHAQTLEIQLKADRPTSLQIALPREVLDSKSNPEDPNSADSDFAVFVDQIPIDPTEISMENPWKEALGISDHPEKYRILLIPVEQGSKMVEIVSTWLP